MAGNTVTTGQTNLTIYGQVTVGQYPVPGNYTDTIIATAQNSGNTTGTFGVNVNVSATCTISANPLAFGTYTSLQANAATTLSITCTNTTPYNVGLNAGIGSGGPTVTSRRMNGPSGATLNYSVFQDSARTINWGQTASTDTEAGTGNGGAQALTLYGRVAAGQYVRLGSYADTITATITY